MRTGQQPIATAFLARAVRQPIIIFAIVFLGLTGVLAALWVPLAPIRLFDFDAANFALALESFQPAAHQPQPPGYPLYVALTGLIHPFTGDASLTFLIAGIIGAAMAVLLLGILAARMFGLRTAIFSALLLMTNPILWQTGMSDQVRIYIAVISIGVALTVWPGWEARLTPLRFAVTGFLLGLLAGFRPEMLVSMTPLPVIAAFRSRLKLTNYLAAAVAVSAGMAPWFLVLLSRVGGIDGFLAMMGTYSAEQAGGSSLLFGAGWSAAWKMAGAAFWWASLGVAAWSPVVLLVGWRKVALGGEEKVTFLLVWFLSLFLFSIAVHIAASGHSLGFIPVLCLAGGWMISAAGTTRGRLLMVLSLFGALSLNIAWFFRPYSAHVREASFQTVAGIGDINEAVLDSIDRRTQSGETFLISDDSWVSWRILEYYYPGVPLLYIPAPLAQPGTRLPVWLIQHHMRIRNLDPQGELSLPGCGTIAWLVRAPEVRRTLLAMKGAEEERYVITLPAQPGMHITIGRYRLAAAAQPCAPPVR